MQSFVGDKDVQGLHLLHGLVADDVQLAGVEALIDLLRGAIGLLAVAGHSPILAKSIRSKDRT